MSYFKALTPDSSVSLSITTSLKLNFSGKININFVDPLNLKTSYKVDSF